MEQSDFLRRNSVALVYARCERCGYMGRVIVADEDIGAVFDEARQHARDRHAGGSMAGVEVVWDVLPSL
ncbi:hypothetical protein ACGFS9_22730 [Streptomyces sp. NPDC048566]|uniref:hypothetical protein n=1 Tax=Streptomyces sp. NPDC048566 TaxID=3365569 RepID=UPI00371CD5A3